MVSWLSFTQFVQTVIGLYVCVRVYNNAQDLKKGVTRVAATDVMQGLKFFYLPTRIYLLCIQKIVEDVMLRRFLGRRSPDSKFKIHCRKCDAVILQ